jgi:hypothetical protein
MPAQMYNISIYLSQELKEWIDTKPACFQEHSLSKQIRDFLLTIKERESRGISTTPNPK